MPDAPDSGLTNARPRTARARLETARDAVGASLRAAFGDDGSVGARERGAIGALASAAALGFFALAWQRYATFHNRNFDLAFYARLAWGDAHGDAWEPLLDAHVLGLHLVWPLELLGRIGLVLGQVRTLLLAQSIAVAAAAWPLARLSARALRTSPREGGLAALAPFVGALGWLLHPNLWHVATGDFHPGTLAVLPLAWAAESLHRRNVHGLAWSALGVLACREDLALVVALFGAGLVFGSREPAKRRVGAAIAALSLLYLAVFLGYFHRRYAPAEGSFVQHFGRWGPSPPSALAAIATQPGALLAWLARPERAPYLLVVTAPLSLLAFLAPEWLALAFPILALNLLSAFPTTLFLDSHYLTPAVPILVAASVVGAARAASVARALGRPIGGAGAGPPLLASALVAHVLHGGSPLSARFDALAYQADTSGAALEQAVSLVPEGASIQAPERVLAHFSERRTLRRAPPPETEADYVLFDAWHRRLDAHREELLRTEEEPLLRDWLAREDHALVHARDGVYLLARGAPRSEDVGLRHIVGRAPVEEGRALTRCLALHGARIERSADGSATLVLTLGARARCDTDLALRIGWGYRPRRVDLLADGALSPARLQPGDRLESRHGLAPGELAAIEAHGLRVGAIRQSGARPSPEDPVALDVPLVRGASP
ncbi:MAG: DUF2079 domain-containing protein [Deltaproteobacteria bacterium]